MPHPALQQLLVLRRDTQKYTEVQRLWDLVNGMRVFAALGELLYACSVTAI